jgi:hypothetical protein
VELYLHSPNTPSWRGAQLKHRDNFTFNRFFENITKSNIWEHHKQIKVAFTKKLRVD